MKIESVLVNSIIDLRTKHARNQFINPFQVYCLINWASLGEIGQTSSLSGSVLVHTDIKLVLALGWALLTSDFPPLPSPSLFFQNRSLCVALPVLELAL